MMGSLKQQMTVLDQSSNEPRLAMRIFNNHSYMDFEGGCKNNNSWSLKLLQPTNLHVAKSILDKILSHLQRKTKT